MSEFQLSDFTHQVKKIVELEHNLRAWASTRSIPTLSYNEIGIIEIGRRKESSNDRQGCQTLSAHVDDHVDGQVEAKEQVQESQDGDGEHKVPDGDVEPDDVLHDEVDVDGDDQHGQQHWEDLGSETWN